MPADKPGPQKRAKQKRNRIITACYDCRERKAGCDRKKPVCTRCQDGSGRMCIFLDPPTNALVNGVSRSVRSLPPDIKEKVTNLYSQCQGDNRQEEDDTVEDYDGLEPSPLHQDSAVYENDADADAVDVGYRVGKTLLTGRIGGTYRPVMVQELKALLEETSLQAEWAEEQAIWPTPPGIFEYGMITPDLSFMKPSETYFAPNLSMISNTDATVNFMQYLPPYAISVKILDHYWAAVHPVGRILHRPSFEKRWQTFTHDLTMQARPTKALQAIVFAVLFSGIATMPPGTLDRLYATDQALWTHNLKCGVELALSHARIFSSTNIETLQAFVAYLIIICGGEVSRSHATLVAAAIRVAEINGLQVDPRSRGYNSIETHIRRLIWFSLGCLDIRVTEAQGPRPTIRTNEYKVKFPVNVNDADLVADSHIEPTESRWTEMTVPLIRYRCNEFMRTIFIARTQILAREQTLAPVIKQIESFRLEWSLQFAPTDPDDPIQRFGVRLLEILLARCAVMVLHPFHKHAKIEMPVRLVSILTDNAVRATERSIEIETFEEFSLWRWFDGAIHQHQSALLMAIELLINPRRKEAARIWQSLNYVFSPPQLPPIARARWVITQFWLRMEVYLSQRSLLPPMALSEMLREALDISDGQKAVFNHRSTAQGSNVPPHNSEPKQPHHDLHQQQSISGPPANYYSGLTETNAANASTSLPSPISDRMQNTSTSPTNPSGSPFSDGFNWSSARTKPSGKQLMEVDWSMLESVYTSEQFTADPYVPYDRWNQLLQTVPFPALGDVDSSVNLSSSSAAYPSTASVFNPAIMLPPSSLQQHYLSPIQRYSQLPSDRQEQSHPSAAVTAPLPSSHQQPYEALALQQPHSIMPLSQQIPASSHPLPLYQQPIPPRPDPAVLNQFASPWSISAHDAATRQPPRGSEHPHTPVVHHIENPPALPLLHPAGAIKEYLV